MDLAAWTTVTTTTDLPSFIGLCNTRLGRALDLLARTQRDSVRTIAADAQVTEGDDVIGINTAGGSVVASLPPVTTCKGKHLTFKKLAAGNTATLDGDGALIDGAATLAWTTLNQVQRLVSTGTAWWVV